MPISSSSIPSLRAARAVKRRRRASGGAVYDPMTGVEIGADLERTEPEANPNRFMRGTIAAIAGLPKSVLWDHPIRTIEQARDNPLPGLRREDYTDVPADTSPDERSALGGVGINAPKVGWQPVDPMVGSSLEAGMNVMGGTSLSAPARGAGEFVAGAGPRDPRLWHGISKVKLPKPVSEMSAVHVPTGQAAERVIDPASMQGGRLLPLVGDRTGAGTRLTQVNGYKFDNPVEMQGGHGFMASNADRGAAWASGQSVTSGLGKKVRGAGGDQPVYGVYTAMGERSGDFSHHISDTLSEMIPHSPITKAGRRSFDDEMRAIAPEWPGVKSEAMRAYLVDAPGAVRAQFAKLMDTAKYQGMGFPSVAEARFATTDPRLLNVETGASGASIAKLDPEGRTFASPDQHLSYDTNLAGQYHGGLPTSVPKEVMYPDIMRALEEYRDKLPGYKPTTDYLMTRTPKGLPVTQQADQAWVDGVSQYLESKGFTLGAGAADKRAATLALIDDATAASKGYGKIEMVPVDSIRPRPENTAMIEKFKRQDEAGQKSFEAAYPGEKYQPQPGDMRYKVDQMRQALERGEGLPPLAVKRDGSIADGENRWNAYRAAGVETIPVRREVAADRLERAADQGFDTSTPLYHGTSKDADFKKFKDGRHGTWTTTDPKEASGYATQNDSKAFRMSTARGAKPWDMEAVNSADRVLPLYGKPLQNPYNVMEGGYPEKMRTATNYKKAQSEWFDELKRKGHDGVIMPGGPDGSGIRVDFDNANLRGQFAQFDPKNAGKSMILGAGAADKRAASVATFDDWFDGSRAIDEAGKPLTLSHQTHFDVPEGGFDRKFAANYFKRDPEGIDTVGTWFTDSPNKTLYGPKNIDANLNIKNPFVLEDDATGVAWDQLKKLVDDMGGSTNLRKELIDTYGHDGILMKKTDLDGETQNVWIAFEPGQIRGLKSVNETTGQSTVPGGPAAATDAPAVGPGGGGQAGSRSLDEAQATATRWAGERAPLEGAPGALKIGEDYFVPGPIAKVHDVAEGYMKANRPEVAYRGAERYHPIDADHSKAIAQAYDEMKHTPNDPATKASYEALINETKAQYDAIKASGLKIEPIPAGSPDPYAVNPRLAAVDVAENNHLWFFPTEGGFGSGAKINNNPMLRKTGEKIGDHELLANDMFRVVHDYFGHLQHGHGFRAAGEDNAWRSHSSMYSDLARPAMTTETRGQNSWVNYGPHGDKNRTASGADTVYADQKVGLMPDWTMYDKGKEPIYAYHGSPHSFDRFSMDKIGSGEGAQAYGHGLYFAENPKVAKAYRDQLSAGRAFEMNGEPLPWTHVTDMFMGAAKKEGMSHPDQLYQIVNRFTDLIESGKSVQTIRKKYDPPTGFDKPWNAMLDLAEQNNIKFNKKPGHTYKVGIEADPEKFLDYNAVVPTDHPIRKMLAERGEEVLGTASAGMERKRAEAAVAWANNPKMSGQEAYDLLARLYTKPGVFDEIKIPQPGEATRALAKAGVPGIKYLDQGSRNLAQGAKSRNFVAFDDNMVRILRKYGVVGIPAAGVLGADGVERRAEGGAVNSAMDVARRIKRAKGGGVHVGPITGDTGGRADKRPMEVPDGAYVVPADIVSGLGEGNTGAGMLQLSEMFPESKPSLMRGMRSGGIPIYAADGEFVISPDSIKGRWDDIEIGHKTLDAWVLNERDQLVETLKNLPGPAQD